MFASLRKSDNPASRRSVLKLLAAAPAAIPMAASGKAAGGPPNSIGLAASCSVVGGSPSADHAAYLRNKISELLSPSDDDLREIRYNQKWQAKHDHDVDLASLRSTSRAWRATIQTDRNVERALAQEVSYLRRSLKEHSGGLF